MGFPYHLVIRVQAKTAAKPIAGPEATAAPQAEVPAHTVLEDAPEKLSGKGWLQQEQERLARRCRHFDTGPTSVIAPWAARHLAPEVGHHYQRIMCPPLSDDRW